MGLILPLAAGAQGRSTAGFQLVSPASSGVLFTNVLQPASAAQNQVRMNGSGVSAGDVNGDGRVDLFFSNMEGSNALFLNQGNWKFVRSSQPSIELATEWCTGTALVDLDGDSDLDLFVTAIGSGPFLFLNDGKGIFTPAPGGFRSGYGAMTAAFGDLNGDTYLDCYVSNYRTNTVRSTGLMVMEVNGRRMIRPEDRAILELLPDGRILEYGEPDFVYTNNLKGAFQEVPWLSGAFLSESGATLARAPRDWGLTVAIRDINQDGLPDIHVCNDFFTPDRIYLNQGSGTFQEMPELAVRQVSTFSMGIDYADLNHDGRDEFLTVDMLSREHKRRKTQSSLTAPDEVFATRKHPRAQTERNTLLLNQRDGTYHEIAHYSGLEASEWSWSPIFIDVDLDGHEDLLVTTGHLFDTQDMDATQRTDAEAIAAGAQATSTLLLRQRLAVPKQAFRNRGDLTFQEVGKEWGFADVGVAHGMCLADLDNDGDMDVVVNNLNAAAGLYRNESKAGRVAVRLKGEGGNTRGIGARITLIGGAVPQQSQEMIAGGRYLSSDDPMRVFATGTNQGGMKLEVKWRSGKRSVVENVVVNRIYEVKEAEATPGPERLKEAVQKEPLFADESGKLNHRHVEPEYNDFARQGLLGRKLSQLGPGVGWIDLDGDGDEDLVIGSGRGGSMGLYENDGKGGWKKLEGGTVSRDQSGVVLGGGEKEFFIGSSNYEDGLSRGSAVRRYEGARPGEEVLAAWESSAGVLLTGVLDSSGELKMFVGARVIGGRYPESGKSKILGKKNGKWEVENEFEAGLVSGGVISDLDGDGVGELVLATEWGPLRVFGRKGKEMVERTTEFGLGEWVGWWNGVSAGDFNGDGKMDLVGSNWGRNTKYERYRKEGLKLYFGDFNAAGGVELVEGYYEKELKKVVPWRGLESVAQSMPWVREKYERHAQYAEAGVEEILAGKMKKEYSAGTLESMVFLSGEGRKLVGKALPLEAQLSPGFGVSVGDVDGDGNEDVVMSQNFFGMDVESSRCDGGRGLLLRGDGKGGFVAVGGEESGIKVYGEGRGSALADFDGDGRVDIVMSQNGSETKLYRNRGGKAGLRVRLDGGEGNRAGLGAKVQLAYEGGKLGPVREVHGGSGYWSQESAVQVLGMTGKPKAVRVQWAGGKTTQYPVADLSKEVTLKRVP
jgi:hypothetical protein